jgi:hypothetical protein
MRVAGIFGLAALAALALIACAGAGSALAFETTLCKTGSETPYCASANRYPAGTVLSAESSKFKITTSILDMTCSSHLAAETTAQSGNGVPVRATSWTFTGCVEAEGGKCTASVTNLPYAGSLTRTTSWNGTLAFGKGEAGQPQLTAQCGSFMQCNWAAPEMSFVAGTPNLGDATLVKKSGLACPSTAKFESHTYAFTSPGPVFLAVPGNRPPKATALCKGSEEYCEPSNLYPAGTVLKGKSTNFKLVTPAGYLGGNFTCSEATIAAETTAAYSQPLPLKTLEAPDTGCKWSLGSCEVASAIGVNSSLDRSNADGLWAGGGLSWQVKCGGSLACTFTIKSGQTIKIEHGTPGTVRLEELPLTVSGGGICPASASVFGTFPLSSPSGALYVTDVLR